MNWVLRVMGGLVLAMSASVAIAQTNWDTSKMVGPDECGECHEASVEVWRGTHHYSTFTDMPRAKEAREIADAMGIRRIKADSLCLDCHFTVVDNDPVAGISCESCHSPGKDWVKVHSEYSGKKQETETEQEAADRWAKSEQAGMIRPGNTYAIAKNCYNCHVVPQEDLVNRGGHPAGSPFELVSWSQGEVRHNVWWNDASGNPEADQNRRRMLFVIGQAVELETALRAVGEATVNDKYAVAMAERAQTAAKRFAALAGKVDTPETKAIVAALGGVKLSLNQKQQLNETADKVAQQAEAISATYDGSAFGAIDPFIPGSDKYKGEPAR